MKEQIEPGATVKEGFGTTEIQRAAETSAVALAEREKATIQAMFVVADSRRRSVPAFEMGLIKDCERPGFAEVARYKKPQRHRNAETGEWEDGFIEGWSIRFAEAALRHWKNVFCDAKIVYEDAEKRIIRFMLIDLESNLPLSTELQLAKTVERRGYGNKPPAGRDILGERLNTAGQKVYIVAATEDELYMKQASAWSKFIRNSLRFMPGDVLDSCLEQVHKTLKGGSPEAQRDRIIMKFDELGITAANLQEYLGKSISKITPEDVDQLRGIYAALKTEEATWAGVMEARNPSTTDPGLGLETKIAKIRAVEQHDPAAAAKMAADWNIDYPLKPETPINTERSQQQSTVPTGTAAGETGSGSNPERREIPADSTPGKGGFKFGGGRK